MEDAIRFFWNSLNFLDILNNCWQSVRRVSIGVALAILAGILLGFFRSSLPVRLKNNFFIRFLFEAPKFPPPIAWIPFVILFMGIGNLSAYTIVFIGAFAPIFTNTFMGAESVPRAIKDTARSMEYSGWRYFWKIIFPASLPQIFVGIRSGISMGWMSIIAAEMIIGGQSGLGYSIQLNGLNMQYAHAMLDMILISITGFILYEVVVLLEKRIIPWHESMSVENQFDHGRRGDDNS